MYPEGRVRHRVSIALRALTLNTALRVPSGSLTARLVLEASNNRSTFPAKRGKVFVIDVFPDWPGWASLNLLPLSLTLYRLPPHFLPFPRFRSGHRKSWAKYFLQFVPKALARTTLYIPMAYYIISAQRFCYCSNNTGGEAAARREWAITRARVIKTSCSPGPSLFCAINVATASRGYIIRDRANPGEGEWTRGDDRRENPSYSRERHQVITKFNLISVYKTCGVRNFRLSRNIPNCKCPQSPGATWHRFDDDDDLHRRAFWFAAN